MRMFKTMTVLMISGMGGLCGGCAEDPGADVAQEDTATVEQGLITGAWAGPFNNGDAGPSPLVWNGVVPCEAYSFGDNRYHPGKLWAGTCRYEYNSGVLYAVSYYTLQSQSGMFAISNPGFTPSNAITGSPSAQLPVCAPFYYPQSTGKVWQGTCRFEWGDAAHAETGFWFLAR